MSAPVVTSALNSAISIGNQHNAPKPTSSPPLDASSTEGSVLATGSYDQTIKLWRVHNGNCLRTLQHTDSQVNALQISPDCQLLAACGYQHIRMFDVNQKDSSQPLVNYEGVSKNVTDVGFQEQGRWMYTGGEDGSVKIWDLRNRTLNCQRILHAKAPVNSVALNPNQQEIVVGDQSGSIHVWNLRSNTSTEWKVDRDLSAPAGVNVLCVDVDCNGKYLSAVTNRGKCYIYDLKSSSDDASSPSTATLRHRIDAHDSYALKCRFSPDAAVLATCAADATTKLWRTNDFELIFDLCEAGQRWVWDVCFSGDSQHLFTATSDSLGRLWELPTQELKVKYEGHQKGLTCIAFRDSNAL